MTKRITLLGSTGSIGTQSLDVIRAQGYEVFGLTANRNAELLLRQIAEFHPKAVAVVDPAAAQRVKSELEGMSQPPLLLEGPQGLTELAAMPGAFCSLGSFSTKTRSDARDWALHRSALRASLPCPSLASPLASSLLHFPLPLLL